MVNTNDMDWLESLELPDLSNRALVLCSRFARELKRVNGTNLVLRDPKLPKTISQVLRTTQSPGLIRIFDELIKEIEALFEQRGEPRYRGALSSTSAKIDESQITLQTNAVKTYRGTVIAEGRTQAANTGINTNTVSGNTTGQPDKKPKMYRGVIIKH